MSGSTAWINSIQMFFAEQRKIVILYKWSLNSIGSKKKKIPLG